MSDREHPAAILFVDGSAGASGDMILGALVDLGVPSRVFRDTCASLGLDGVSVTFRRVQVGGISARKARVRVGTGREAASWSRVRRRIRGAGLAPAIRDRALAVFRRLFEAEARVHGSTPERVHLHEAGSADALIDVVGACAGLAHLSPSEVVASPLTTGYGTIRCSHGEYPVPAPATLELLRGIPALAGDLRGERLTPTGAAILAEFVSRWEEMPLLVPNRIGHGAGDRSFGDRPNVLRMILGRPAVASHPGREPRVAVLQTVVDDVPPQSLAFATERLLEAGALDVFVCAGFMKKGRLGHEVTVLARPEDVAEMSRALLRETSSLGLRYRIERRVEVERTMHNVRTRYGRVRVKVGTLDGERIRAWPEYEDAAAAARRHGVRLEEVQREALRVLSKQTEAQRGEP